MQSVVSCRLEFLGTLTTGAAAFLAVAGNTAPYKAGLSLTYALSVTQALNWFVRMNADLENNSVAVERVVDQVELLPKRMVMRNLHQIGRRTAPWKSRI